MKSEWQSLKYQRVKSKRLKLQRQRKASMIGRDVLIGSRSMLKRSNMVTKKL